VSRHPGRCDSWRLSKSSTTTRRESSFEVARARPVAPPSDSRSEGGAFTPQRSKLRPGWALAPALLAALVLSAGCAGETERSDDSSVAGTAAGASAAAGRGGGGSSGTDSSPVGAGPGAGAAGSDSAVAGSGAPSSVAMLSFAADVYEGVLRRRCAACHTDAPSFGGLAFFPGGAAAAYANLVGVPAGAAAGNLCRDSGLLRVQPGDPDASLIYLKLTNPPCGSQMPPAAFVQATPEQVEVVRQWIADGAAP
jgi:hypothetical protein